MANCQRPDRRGRRGFRGGRDRRGEDLQARRRDPRGVQEDRRDRRGPQAPRRAPEERQEGIEARDEDRRGVRPEGLRDREVGPGRQDPDPARRDRPVADHLEPDVVDADGERPGHREGDPAVRVGGRLAEQAPAVAVVDVDPHALAHEVRRSGAIGELPVDHHLGAGFRLGGIDGSRAGIGVQVVDAYSQREGLVSFVIRLDAQAEAIGGALAGLERN